MKEKILIALMFLFVILYSIAWSILEYQLCNNPNIGVFILLFGVIGIIVTTIIFCKSCSKKNQI